MEEPIAVRYTFVMLLAIADPEGYVIGTDVAIARRLNMKLTEFTSCLHALMKPDPFSNSKVLDGRRIVKSDADRGYLIVNYASYRDLKDPKSRRDYMREYMRSYRETETEPVDTKDVTNRVNNPVNTVNNGKPQLAQLGHVDVDVDVDANGEAEEQNARAFFPEAFAKFWQTYPRKIGKRVAFTSWKRAKKAVCDETGKSDDEAERHIQAAAEAFAASDKGRGEFCPHASTWLNQGRYDDDPDSWKDRTPAARKPSPVTVDISTLRFDDE